MPASLPHITIPDSAARVLEALESAGFEGWVVGGFVRDSLLGRDVHDVDIATNARWPQAQAVFESYGWRTFETGIEHGTLTVAVGGDVIEATTYRSDGTYSDARHPDKVAFVDSIDADLARRDFTVNAIAYHPRQGIRDPFGGIEDLEHGIIRTVGSPIARFEEDALRILRAVRFSSTLGFDIDPATEDGMVRASRGLERISAERIAHELEATLCGSHVHDAIMAHVETLGYVLPELLPMKGFDQRTPYHIYDVLEHTAYVVQNTPAEPLVRWVGLFHDMGKPDAFSLDGDGRGHFYGHAAISVRKAEGIMARLKMSPRFAHDALLLVAHHDDVVEAVPKQVKRMLRKLDGKPDLFRTLCDIKKADALSQAPRCRKRVELADDLETCMDAILQAGEPFSLKGLAVNGSDVLSMGIEPGPAVGQLLQSALEAVIDERIPNEHAALLDFMRNTSSHDC